MAIKTYAEQLEEVQTAISKILTKGQAWGANGQSLSRADLPTLYEMQKELMPLYQQEIAGRSGMRVRGVTVVDT